MILLKYCLAVLIIIGGVFCVVNHNRRVAHDAMVKLAQAQAKPFDGGSTVKAMRTWQPK